MKAKVLSTIAAFIIMSATMSTRAEELSVNEDKGISISLGADVVSSYVWRGSLLDGASVQPAISLDVAGLSVGMWGSTSLTSFANWSNSYKELDLYVSYAIKGFSVTLTDYFCATENDMYFRGWGDVHILEGTVGYDFSECFNFPLSVAWNTNFVNDDDYSTYIHVGYDFAIKGVDMSAGVGVTPWKGAYASDFNVTDISLRATKTFSLKNFEPAIWVEGIFAPAANDAFLVVGFSF